MRKHINHKWSELNETINEIIKTTKATFCNPIKIKKWRDCFENSYALDARGRVSKKEYKTLLDAF